MSVQIQLQTTSVRHLPLQYYQKDFTFIINNKEFSISRVIADLISLKISNLHQIDPTIVEYSINTKFPGDFNNVLSLFTFQTVEIVENEIPFLNEIFSELEISAEYVKIILSIAENDQDSSISKLQKYQQLKYIYEEEITKEIEKLSKHLYELKDDEKRFLSTLSPEIIESIISHPSIQLSNEDQLLDIINDLYQKDRQYCNLYSYVHFTNVTGSKMKEFVSHIIQEDITRTAWLSISSRLCKEVVSEEEQDKTRYKEQKPKYTKEILYHEQEFDGIINYLRKQTNIQDEITISYSSLYDGDPQNLFNYENKNTYCQTRNYENSWFCFEFKKHEIIPTNYTIRTQSGSSNSRHLKNWVFEGSKDNQKWTKLDEENNCSYLNGSNFVHTFPINNESQNSFKYLRIRQTGLSWYNDNLLLLGCIEFYGQLI